MSKLYEKSKKIGITYLISTIGRKCIFVQPLMAFKVKDGLEIWTKFIEKIKIRQWQPNSELI